MHESTKQKIDEALKVVEGLKKRISCFHIESCDIIYLYLMKFARKYKFWSDSVEEIEQYIAEKTILKGGV